MPNDRTGAPNTLARVRARTPQVQNGPRVIAGGAIWHTPWSGFDDEASIQGDGVEKLWPEEGPGGPREDEMSRTETPGRVSRRAFLGAAAGSAAWLAAGGLAGFMTGTASAAKPTTTIRNPLYVPPTLAPTAVTLTSAPGSVDLGGGRASKAWVYNGSLPGPTFRARTGDTATITLDNGLASDTITHWHGMLVDHENDGHPMMAIAPGETYEYNFPIQNRAALNWYHPHPHMLTGEQVAMGLAGAFIINDAAEDALHLPGGAYEVPLVLRDTAFDSAGNIAYKPRSGGFEGGTPLVNGTLNPYLDVDAALYRLRVLGGSNARIFRLALSNGASFTVVGNDGGLLERSVAVPDPDLSPGERLDLLVDFSGLPVGTTIMLRDTRAGWNLLEFRVVRSGTTAGTIPTNLSTIEKLANPVATRDFSFDGMTKINGREYDMGRIDFQVPFGQVERWRFRTNGNAPHPVHVHGASFQVQKRTGGRNRTYAWESGWKDTVLLEDRETVEVLIRFDAYRGLYLMHCHKLEHEDMGMMSNFEVV
jgi:FtsP/CotA-like multicopper oxidase with cupredoxin domain